MLEFCLKAYLVNLFQGLIDTQTWSDEGSVSERILRNYLLLFACVRRYAPCISTAQDLFSKWKESGGNMRSEFTINKILIHSFSLQSLTMCTLSTLCCETTGWLLISAWLCTLKGHGQKKVGTSLWKCTVTPCIPQKRVRLKQRSPTALWLTSCSGGSQTKKFKSKINTNAD